MTVRLTLDEFTEQFQEAGAEELPCDPTDELDRMLKFELPFSQGWSRRITLREDIHLEITQNQIRDRMVLGRPAMRTDYVGCHFYLSGNHRIMHKHTASETFCTGGRYLFCSTGSRLYPIDVDYDTTLYSAIVILMHQKVFRSFATSLERKLVKHLRHLIVPVDKELYRRFGNIQPTMITALQQILHCPYQGMIKRAYVESKVLELLALVLADETAVQQGEVKQRKLKPEQIERIYYAREILLRDLSNPPSVAELSRQVGLNDQLLREGFHQAFDTTIFGELQAHRLEIAKSALAEQNISVAEVAHLIGYVSARSFARAFKRRYGIGPKAYQKACR